MASSDAIRAWTGIRPAATSWAPPRRSSRASGAAAMSSEAEERAGLNDIEDMGPVDYLVIEFPGNRMTGQGLPMLVDLVDRGIIRILDLVFVRKDEDGTVRALELRDLGDEVDLTVFEGASSGLLDQSDIDDAGTALEPGNSAGVLV